jgi:hypothetical protein
MAEKSVVRTEAAPAPFQGAPYSQAIVAGDSRPYSIAEIPFAPASDARPLMASRGDPAKVPGVWVQSGSSAIRSPVIP